MNVIILGPIREGGLKIPLFSFKVPAGFPSPAADHIEQDISLDEICNVRAPHVYMARLLGDSMEGAGLLCGDLIVIDRSLDPKNGQVVVAVLNAEPLCKRLYMQEGAFVLRSENSKYPPRYVMEGDELFIWGVVRHCVHTLE
jgi:DNA polymerase V